MDAKHYFHLTIFLCFVVLGETNECRFGCYFNNTLHLVNETFTDGCNSCVCTETGALCGRMWCGTPVKKAETGCFCETFYPVGRKFPHRDGCNKCTCQANGPICSTMVCEEKPSEAPRSQFVVSDCRSGQLRCLMGDCVSYAALCLNEPGSVCEAEDYNTYCSSACSWSATVLGLAITVCGILVQFL